VIAQCWSCGVDGQRVRMLDVGVDGKVWTEVFCDPCVRRIKAKLREVCASGDNRRPECRRDTHCPHCDAFRQGEPLDAVALQDMLGPRPLDGDL
jgi:hypothetical protein